MKFVSKSSNLLVVLRPGLSAQPLTGTPAKPTISVRFKDGLADVQQEEIIEMMLAHPGYNSDYICAETDPYSRSRQSSEPDHIVTEVKFGTPTSRTVSGGLGNLPPEIQKVVQDLALNMAKEMIPSLLQELVKSHRNEQSPITPKTKKKPGRKPKNKITEQVVQSLPTQDENPLTENPIS